MLSGNGLILPETFLKVDDQSMVLTKKLSSITQKIKYESINTLTRNIIPAHIIIFYFVFEIFYFIILF